MKRDDEKRVYLLQCETVKKKKERDHFRSQRKIYTMWKSYLKILSYSNYEIALHYHSHTFELEDEGSISIVKNYEYFMKICYKLH